jgi:predicted phage baseplate assembly protein
MIASIEQRFDPNLPGDYSHTALKLAEAMNYQYRRDSVTLYGNVVKATHGETRKQVLGNGDGSKRFQQFALSFSPLTHVAANTPSGVETTLQVRVNDILWDEAVSLFGLDSNDRDYITRTDNEDKTTVQFGDGQRGLRVPTGVENVSATYRSGIGKSGNVAAEQISLLASRPLGVKAVINPLPATGGADRDSRDQARRNAPYAIMALDRLVSVQDYADFARTFAGIGKASAVRLSDGYRQVVHVTIAGVDDIPISPSSDLYRSLRSALYQYGDPHQAIELVVRELIVLIVQAKVRVQAEYQWETVEPEVRAALLDHFSFERRELGQDAWLSEAISIIKGVAGVEYVDVDVFDGLVETESTEVLIRDIESLADPQNPSSLLSANQPNAYVIAEMARLPEALFFTSKSALQRKVEALNLEQRHTVILPAQIAVLDPDIKDTLILTELT